jgi:hypothetical protein
MATAMEMDGTQPPTRSPQADDGRPGNYLTDGTRLFRFLGRFPSGGRCLAGLEDCHSLELVLLPVEDLGRLSLRWVIAGGPAPHGDSAEGHAGGR